ncbi:hypothetical protein HPB50_027282 [Hyalomma asiaticum]|uniref:Uncharacterized protein n=1 Tax=Hyalomma asiaticum TaxID=266040 RepID=A0ACB7T8A0_HYAAI|nr:hypothetical protein HPB50_027282 [Hyalomma asiaticum]
MCIHDSLKYDGVKEYAPITSGFESVKSTVRLPGGLSSEPVTCTATMPRKVSMSYNTDKVAGGRFQRDEVNVLTLTGSCSMVCSSSASLSGNPHAEPTVLSQK